MNWNEILKFTLEFAKWFGLIIMVFILIIFVFGTIMEIDEAIQRHKKRKQQIKQNERDIRNIMSKQINYSSIDIIHRHRHTQTHCDKIKALKNRFICLQKETLERDNNMLEKITMLEKKSKARINNE